MNTMMNENELAAVVGGRDGMDFELPPEFSNLSIDGIDLYSYDQFQPLPDSMNLNRNTKSDPEWNIVWTDNGGVGR